MGLFGKKASDPVELYNKGKALFDKGKYKAAFECYEEAAEMGYAEAQYALAAKADCGKAAYWYEKAAEQGHAPSQRSLGTMYFTGKGVEQDLVKAAHWYEKAAEQGHADSQANLGRMYYSGEGIEQDFAKAVYWYEKAAEQGDKSAQYNLGMMYQNGEGVEKDAAKAADWYEDAANQGNPYAQDALGDMYYYGEGVGRNLKYAAYWYDMAENSMYNSAYRLAMMYYNGEGVERDYEKASILLAESADTDDADVEYHLALIYRDGGYGAERIPRLAVEWAAKAAAQGHEEAIAFIREFEKRGEITLHRSESIQIPWKLIEKMEETETALNITEDLEDGDDITGVEIVDVIGLLGDTFAAVLVTDESKYVEKGEDEVVLMCYEREGTGKERLSYIDNSDDWDAVYAIYKVLVNEEEV